ncbi:unnamed protein product [Paramecium octaurelia]|uniref:Uncharacterized protein n=1 Tax=Paramecium octaurelia TaxID=43137 RepID=A0A8S1SI16_PAROT|nr:unnamed protein product [Paramecium octaurelia]
MNNNSGDQNTYQCEFCKTFVPNICRIIHDQKCSAKCQQPQTMPQNNITMQNQGQQSNNNNNNKVDGKIDSMKQKQDDNLNLNSQNFQQKQNINNYSSQIGTQQNQFCQLNDDVYGRQTNPYNPQTQCQNNILHFNNQKQQSPVQDSNTQNQFGQSPNKNQQQIPQNPNLFQSGKQWEPIKNSDFKIDQQFSYKKDAY